MASLLEVSKILTGAMVMFPDFKLTVTEDSWTGAWYRHVGHLPAAQLQAAMDRAVRGAQYGFPRSHDVLKAAAQLSNGEGLTALEAWAKVKFAMRAYGNYHAPIGLPQALQVNSRPWTFQDEKITRAIAGIGWEQLFEGSEDTMRAHFIHAYDAMTLHEMRQALELPAPDAPKQVTP